MTRLQKGLPAHTLRWSLEMSQEHGGHRRWHSGVATGSSPLHPPTAPLLISWPSQSMYGPLVLSFLRASFPKYPALREGWDAASSSPISRVLPAFSRAAHQVLPLAASRMDFPACGPSLHLGPPLSLLRISKPLQNPPVGTSTPPPRLLTLTGASRGLFAV